MFRFPIALIAGVCVCSASCCNTLWADDLSAEKILVEGNLAAGQKRFEKRLSENPTNDRDQFGLGVIQFVSAVETMSQSFYACGVRDHRGEVPFLRIVSAENPNPRPTSYQDVRKIMRRFVDDLKQAEQTLAKVKDPQTKLPLPLFQIRFDLNGDGETTEQETLGAVALQLGLAPAPEADDADQRQIDPHDRIVAFDYADSLWLRGYCHLLSGVAEAYLAYDMRQLHDRVGYLFFLEIDSPHAYLAEANRTFAIGDRLDVVDLIAMIHLINFPVKEADRLQAAHAHFLEVVKLSRLTWDAIEAETDNDREWIPSTKQTSAVSTLRMTPEMLQGWRAFLDELEAILQGEKLVRHLRISGDRGINVKRVFFEPSSFDLVMWIHGSAATPYLEKGPTTDVQFWNQLNRTYGGNFVNFAIWFN